MSLLKSSIPTPLFRRGPADTLPSRAPFSRTEQVPVAPVAAPPVAAPVAPVAEPVAEPPPPRPTKAKVTQPRRPAKSPPPPDRSKGGRPRHNPETVRSVKITLSVSPEEAAVLSAAAAASGMAFSTWFRHVCFDVAHAAVRPHLERATLGGSA